MRCLRAAPSRTAAAQIVSDCRADLAALLQVADPSHIALTASGTDAINLAIKGVLQTGDHVVTTWMEHNAVLRPLRALERCGAIRVTRVRADEHGVVDAADLASALQDDTRLVVVGHASNVNGALQPVAAIAAAAHAGGALVLVDAAQTLGYREVHPLALGADLLAFPGHKGLLGPVGTGGLWVRDGIEVEALRQGESGPRDEDDAQPQDWPFCLEAGTPNLPGIAGLAAGVEQVLEFGIHHAEAARASITGAFLGGVAGLARLVVRGPQGADRGEPVFAIEVDGLDPATLADALAERFCIDASAGVHSAPFAHRTLGTFPAGAVRLSFGTFHDSDDVARVIDALRRLTAVAG